MPNFGILPFAQNWLRRWEAAQAARYAAWTSAATVQQGVMGVIATAGTALKTPSGSTGLLATFSAAGRFASGPSEGLSYK